MAIAKFQNNPKNKLLNNLEVYIKRILNNNNLVVKEAA